MYVENEFREYKEDVMKLLDYFECPEGCEKCKNVREKSGVTVEMFPFWIQNKEYPDKIAIAPCDKGVEIAKAFAEQKKSLFAHIVDVGQMDEQEAVELYASFLGNVELLEEESKTFTGTEKSCGNLIVDIKDVFMLLSYVSYDEDNQKESQRYFDKALGVN
ncbi:hypothetical protein SAMN04488587_1165 [Methanococcoides vulcani]|uniref:Uncharacterized protein n=1 Tax=Methanococcoides vulcani TaxID=1353158 RepID=A0A1H9ZP80_9EURY|nr:hypothetical protein [Methanococcoides vulcani]SES83485.1 hypothetical protein SAMN04488587_1165 [Methanococcoides vulcani]